LQLPPTILSEKAARDGLAITLMQRMIEKHGDKVKKKQERGFDELID